MRLVLALFVLAVLVAAVGLSVWDGRLRPADTNLRAIHYDTQYDLSAQRRAITEPEIQFADPTR